MKKISLILMLAIFLYFPLSANATSGACSDHGGVNCAAGPSPDGNVICNDGWINSSVDYYDTDECTPVNNCVQPSTSEYSCTSSSDANALSQSLARNGSWGPGSQGQSAGDQCEQDIIAYQNAIQTYQACLSNFQTQQQAYNTAMEQETNQLNSEASAITQNAQENITCGQQLGLAHFDTASNRCACDDGSVNLNGKCTTMTLYCTSQYGTFSIPDPTSTGHCTCTDGYQLNNNQCVSVISPSPTEIQPPIITTPTPLITNIPIPKSSKNKNPKPVLSSSQMLQNFLATVASSSASSTSLPNTQIHFEPSIQVLLPVINNKIEPTPSFIDKIISTPSTVYKNLFIPIAHQLTYFFSHLWP